MNGLRVGIGEGGGYGKMLAQMMVHGETEWDTWQLDPRRIMAVNGRVFTSLMRNLWNALVMRFRTVVR